VEVIQARIHQRKEMHEVPSATVVLALAVYTVCYRLVLGV
jgi:hypothetical protein